MKQKKPHIKVNLDKENPLITIVKAGKIPVIRRDKDGFKNHNQDAYFTHMNESAKTPITDYPKTGCFCLLGGIFGNWVTGSHYKETLNIGFVEPDTIVFSTYGYDKSCQWKYVTAKERHMDAMREFIESYNCGIDTIYDTEDFELSEEAIIDAKDITKVCTIDYKDYYKLIKYSNDTMYSLFQTNNLFDTIIYDLPKQFFLKYNVETLEDFHKVILKSIHINDYDYDGHLYWFSSLQNCIMNDIKDFVVNKNKNTAYHTLAFIDAIKTYPLYPKPDSTRAFDMIESYLDDTDIYDKIIKLFPELKGYKIAQIRSNDKIFSVKFEFDSYHNDYTKKYHKNRTIIMEYYVKDRELTMRVEEDKNYCSNENGNLVRKVGTTYDVDLNHAIKPEFQACTLCFTALFDIYMNHFGRFFLIRPFDTYYRLEKVLNKIKELDNQGYDWKLSDDMECISYADYTNHKKCTVTYNFALNDSVVTYE